MRIINLTPHEIVIVVNGNEIRFPASGTVARIAVASVQAKNITMEGISIPCFFQSHGTPEGVPPTVKGTRFIVSALVRAAMPQRYDLLSPEELIRDEKGQPIGCKGFVVNGEIIGW